MKAVAELPQAISVDDDRQREANAPEPFRGVFHFAVYKHTESEIRRTGTRQLLGLKPARLGSTDRVSTG